MNEFIRERAKEAVKIERQFNSKTCMYHTRGEGMEVDDNRLWGVHTKGNKEYGYMHYDCYQRFCDIVAALDEKEAAMEIDEGRPLEFKDY